MPSTSIRISLFLFLFSIPVIGNTQPDANLGVKTAIDSLLELARSNDHDFGEALQQVYKAKDLALRYFGDQSIAYADCLVREGRILFRQEKFEGALNVINDAMHLLEVAVGKEHPSYVASVLALGDIYLQQGNFSEAETWLLQADSICRRMGATEDDDFASLLTSLGNFYRITGDLTKAEECYRGCLRIRENIYGKFHQYYASALHNVALILNMTGNFESAVNLFRETQSIYSQTIGTNSINYSICIENLAITYRTMGNFKQAEKLGLESLALTANQFGDSSANYAKNLETMANLYMEMGDYQKAHDYYSQCKSLREVNLGKDHYLYALALNNLGSYYRAVRDFAKAEQSYREAISIYTKSLGSEHYYTVLAKDNLAWSFRDQKKYAEAEPLIREVAGLREKYQGSEHPDLARSLVNLGFLNKQLKKYAEAQRLFLRAKEIFGKAYGTESMDYLATLYELVNLETHLGHTEDALKNLTDASYLQKSAFFSASRHMTENELSSFTDRFSNYINFHFSFLEKICPEPGELTALAFDNALFQKGFLLDQSSRVKAFTIHDPAFTGQYERLGQLQSDLSKEYVKNPAERNNLRQIQDEINVIEKKLVESVEDYEKRFYQVNWREIQHSLKPGEVVLEFIHFDSFPDELEIEKIRYAALVLRGGDDYPAFVPLCAEKEFASKMQPQEEKESETIKNLYSYDRQNPENSLYRLLWQPLEAYLNGAQTVYFAPSGLLHRLNFGAIQNQNGAVLADCFQLVQIGSTRPLGFPFPTQQDSRTAALFGGIHFDADFSNPLALESTLEKNTGELATRNIPPTDSSEIQLRGGNWNYLNWTKTEVETISLLLGEAGLNAMVFTELNGSETVFKKLGTKQPSPRIIHLATHGYFFPAPTPASPAKSTWSSSEHLMIRSGLILAGANYAWENGQPIQPDSDDGILTAFEIAQLDLSETELVVLSACETGLGDISGIEGVYGLQRAFKFAGVRYLLMSLWQVPDFQTQELMSAFYFNFLLEKMDIPAAFRAAQAEMRQKYPDPFLWAGFVLLER